MKKIFIIVAAAFLFGCNSKNREVEWNHLVQSNQKLTDVIITDIFTPPVASRIYAYTNLAAYESLAPFYPEYNQLKNQLKDFDYQLESDELKDVSPEVASFVAFNETAKKLVFDEMAIDSFMIQKLDSIKVLLDDEVYENSIVFGKKISHEIIKYANSDNYSQRTALSRHKVSSDPGKWIPTPPDYMEGIEPNWSSIRPMTLDSAGQFKPQGPTLFDTVSTSQFYKDSELVYTTVNNLTKEQKEIAAFWDCNPNISYHRGHMMFYVQKLSPGGHWVAIVQQVVQAEGLNIIESAEAFTVTTIALSDAFISCWDEKYRSNLVRPQTYINRYIDEDWEPVLQTPAFPEHTSGHSVISTSAATALTHLFGDGYAFVDSSEVPFGLPAREFESFYDASEEAAISRLYGGIHYMPAIEHGVKQGKKVGNYIVGQLKTRK